MGACRVFLLFTISSSLLFPCAAQQSPSPDTQQPKRDAQAVSIISAAIQAMGGAQISQIRALDARGTVTAAAGSSSRSGTFVWRDQVTAQGFEFRKELQMAGATEVFLSGHGKPARVTGSKVEKIAAHVATATLPYYSPSVVLSREFANSGYNFSVIGQSSVNGQPAAQLHLSIDTNDLGKSLGTQEWFFSASSGLPIRIIYRVPDTHDAARFEEVTTDFGDYRNVSGMLFPFAISTFRGAVPRNTITVNSLIVNPTISTAEFDAPSGGAQ
jgi:hypothetical protein